MGIGSVTHAVLGDRLFSRAASVYRGVFENIGAFIDTIPAFEPGAHVLDIGGGRGHMIDTLLRKYPDTTATIVDISPQVGNLLSAEVADRVELFPSTLIGEYAKLGRVSPDYILLFDVLHHVSPGDRAELFQGMRQVFAGAGGTLIIKDVQPGHWRAQLCFAADKYISNSGPLWPITIENTTDLVTSVFPDAKCEETPLRYRDRPNYCLLARVPAG
jgi:cyclopropane fatty-acyl-phospholipid synthase-like methyltransferase